MGIPPKLIYNAVLCHVCGDLVSSRHRHDFRFCYCGNIAVDGGLEYIRRVGNGITHNTYTDLSRWEGDEDGRASRRRPHRKGADKSR